MEFEKEIGVVTNFHPKTGIAGIKLNDEIKIGDTVVFQDENTLFEQKIESMQVVYNDVEMAEAGQSVRIKVKNEVKENAKVYKPIK
ncbi:MAG: translation elongation factor-like protein [Candidatus Bathyarchaeota archaeon]|nr:translation elongation factor-like protein [Candidatus Bathyarchaeota archaeon]